MGDLERGVSGGGGMSQTMTSQRGSMTEAKSYKNYIGGHWVESKSGRTFTSTNPAHKDQVLGVMQASNADDVNAALEAAQKAFPGWRRTPPPARGEIVLKAALIIEARKDELARLMTQEMGKVLKEARGDVQEAIDMGKYAAGLGRHPHGETVPSELRNKWAMTVRVPLGVVACITPWNFPMAIPSWKIFPAVMAGKIFHEGIAIGKFQGVMQATTPSGTRTVIAHLFLSSDGTVSPCGCRPRPAAYLPMSIASCTSPRASLRTLPISCVISRASSSLRASMIRAALRTISPRAGGGVRRQPGNAFCAASRAAFTSSALDACITPSTWPLCAGLVEVKVRPLFDSTQCPPM